jgi:hypothetical protein
MGWPRFRRGGYASSDRKVTDLRNPPGIPPLAVQHPEHEVRVPYMDPLRSFGPHNDPPLELDGPIARAFLESNPDIPRGRCTNCGTLVMDTGWDDVEHWSHVEPGGYSCGDRRVVVEHRGSKPVRPAVALARERAARNQGIAEGRHREPLAWWEQVGLETWTHGTPEEVGRGQARGCIKSPIDDRYYWLNDGVPVVCGFPHPRLAVPQMPSAVYGGQMITVTQNDTTEIVFTGGNSMSIEGGALHVYDAADSTIAMYAPGRWTDAVKGEAQFEASLFEDIAALLVKARDGGEALVVRVDVDDQKGVVLDEVEPVANSIPARIVGDIAERIDEAKANLNTYGGTGRSIDLRLLVDSDGVVALVKP